MRALTMVNRVKLAYWLIRKKQFVSALMELFPKNRLGDLLWSIYSHRQIFGRFPNLRKPATFNEHLLRLKLSAEMRSGLRVRISDKELVKDYVREKLGEGFTPKTIAILKSENEIINFKFPYPCIIKPTHCSGHFIIRRDISTSVDLKQLIGWLGINYYEGYREANYLPLQPKVIVEELLHEDGLEVPKDYKFFCLYGRPAFIGIGETRGSTKTINCFSPDWIELPISRKDYLPAATSFPKPPSLNRMLEIASALSADFSFMRVDCYQIGQRILVGELTNLPNAATLEWASENIDFCLGQLFKEPHSRIESLLAAGITKTDSRADTPITNPISKQG